MSEKVRNSDLPEKIREVRIDVTKTRRHTHGPATVLESIDKRGMAKMSSRSSDFVYVNSAYVGSVNSIPGASGNLRPHSEVPTTVIREQYWACTRWPSGQKILALFVGILLGALIGLAVALALKNKVSPEDIIGGIFRNQPVKE